MKVLIVDDNIEDRTLLWHIVERHGHQPLAAGNGEEALAMATSCRPDLIISDVLMPVMDGFEFCRRAKADQTLKATPFIFYSATYTEEKDLSLADYLGAEGYIIKPVEPVALWRTVEQILNQGKGEEAKTPAAELSVEDHEYLRRYSTIVAAKLESKVAELQTALAKSEQAEKILQQWGHIFEFAEWGIAVSNADGKSMGLMNPAFAKMHGYTVEELTGRPVVDLFANESRAELPNQVRRAQDTGHHTFEARHLRKDGSTFPVLVDVTAVKDDKGKILYRVVNVQDISERKLLEEQLRQAQKMEAIGTLAGGIAHDFNNILSAILGYADLVQEALPVGSQVWDHQQQVINAGHRAKELVKQILACSRQTEQAKQPVQIHLIVKEALKLLRASIPTTIAIRENIDSHCGMVLADPSQLHQILMNLCTNAFHAMRDTGGALTVTLSREEAPAAAAEGADQLADGLVKLEVSDTGCGMEPRVMEKIFDPYFTTKKKGEGTGLGLAVVHGIVKNCGGHITVASQPGEGTTFRVYLPSLVEGELEAGEALPAAAMAAQPGGNERIMIVDDEFVLAQVGQRILENLGYRVTALSSSHDALSLFTAKPEAFDLVVTDMTMPDLTGAELAAQLLALRPDLPIVLCTGFSEAMTEARAKELGIREYVMKPIGQKGLAEAVRRALAKETKAE